MAKEIILESIKWQELKENEVYYKYLDSGIWYPDTLNKPFLEMAVKEMEQLKRRYNSFFNFGEKRNDRSYYSGQ